MSHSKELKEDLFGLFNFLKKILDITKVMEFIESKGNTGSPFYNNQEEYIGVYHQYASEIWNRLCKRNSFIVSELASEIIEDSNDHCDYFGNPVSENVRNITIKVIAVETVLKRLNNAEANANSEV